MMREGQDCKCEWCSNPSVTSVTVQEGGPPENPKHKGTQADHRRVVVVRACDDHRDKLPRREA